MGFGIKKTGINGLVLIKQHVYEDDRGLYIKHYQKGALKEYGIDDLFNESSDLYSKKGSLRGLHYQSNISQSKLVHVIKGKVYDIALDLRNDSSTYGKYYGIVLNDTDNISMYIPAGFAHGFVSLTDSIFSYMSSGDYLPELCGGIRWDDKELDIPWPLKEYDIDHVIMTEKDKNWPSFAEYSKGITI